MKYLYTLPIIALAIISWACNDPSRKLFKDFINKEGKHFDIVIYNGAIIDGSGKPPFQADLLIKDGSIQFIGQVYADMIEVENAIDAREKVISPGFIDAHAHGNPLSTPSFRNFLKMGVTSICLGQDGSSPMTEDIASWMASVDSIQPGVNIIQFVGHGTLRKLSGAGFKFNPLREEQEKMESLLQAAFDAGCYGMSSGLEYTPGIYAQEEELIALAKIVGKNDGIIMSHVRNEDNDAIEASLRELLIQGQYSKVHAAHLKVVYGKGIERAQEILDLLFSGSLPYQVSADIYPYTASYTGIGIVFPKWAKAPNNYEQVKKELRQELLDFLRNKIIQRNGPEATLLGTTPFAGKTLKDLSVEQGKPFEEILLDIGPTGASGAYFIMNKALQDRLVKHPKIMIGSDGSPSMRHPRAYGSFAKVIEEYTLKEQLFSIETAIHKMSGLTAATLGLKDRGILKVGNKADILVFDPATIKAKATFQAPFQFANGFDYVILNGEIAIKNSQLIEERFGKVLRKMKTTP